MSYGDFSSGMDAYVDYRTSRRGFENDCLHRTASKVSTYGTAAPVRTYGTGFAKCTYCAETKIFQTKIA